MAGEVVLNARTGSRYYRNQWMGMAHSGAVAICERDGVLFLEPRLELGAIQATRRLPGARRRCRSIPFGDPAGQRAGDARGADWARGTSWPNEISSHSDSFEIRRSYELRRHARLQRTEPARRAILADVWRYEPD